MRRYDRYASGTTSQPDGTTRYYHTDPHTGRRTLLRDPYEGSPYYVSGVNGDYGQAHGECVDSPEELERWARNRKEEAA